MRLWIAALATGAALAGAALAEPYPPPPGSGRIADLAGLIAPDAEARIAEKLARLDAETGIEAAVATIATRSAYDPSPSAASFATGLFNAWGIGDATRNDGILILVLDEDREMRVVLGSAYGQGYDVIAQEVVASAFLPDFRDGHPSEAIEAGTDAVIARIARPHASGSPQPSARERGLERYLVPGAIAAAMVAFILSRRGRKGDVTRDRASFGRRRTDRNERERRGQDRGDGRGEGGGFGGGKSDGGGAGGRW